LGKSFKKRRRESKTEERSGQESGRKTVTGGRKEESNKIVHMSEWTG